MKKIILIIIVIAVLRSLTQFFPGQNPAGTRFGSFRSSKIGDLPAQHESKTNIFTSRINQLLPEPQAGLLNGILFGEKTRMDGKFFDQLRRTGTLHVIALSGMNITILVNLLGQTTLFLGRRKSIVLSFLGIVGFIWFVGASASVVRAGIMGGITLTGLYFGRQSWAVLSLLIAAGVMLLFKPVWLYDLGFQLSFLATLGIIVLGNTHHPEQITRHPEFSSGSEPNKQSFSSNKKRMLNQVQHDKKNDIFSSLKADLRTTLAAQVFTLPVLLYNFGQISLVAPLTNVLILWVVAPIMVLGFILSLASIIYYPLSVILSWFVWVPLTYFIKVIEVTAAIPFASITF